MQKRHVKLKYSSNKRLVTVRSQLPYYGNSKSREFTYLRLNNTISSFKPKIFFSKKLPLVGGMAVTTSVITRTDLDN